MSDKLIGQTLAGRYTLKEHVAEEMLGRVYLASDGQTDSLVLVKVLHPYLTQQPDKVRRFAREVSATRAVRHPNTQAVLDHGETGEHHWLVLEYMPSSSVADHVDNNGPMSVEAAIHATAQAADALDAAHQQGVVHRNLNPGNILLLNNAASSVYVKVRDFGLSRLEANEEDAEDGFGEQLTSVGTRIGNSFYMAPEYISDQQVEPRSDIYALGCVLYFMLTGHPPFQGRPGQVLEMHLCERVTPPSREREEIPPWLDELVLHLLAKDPNQRPTAEALAKNLRRSAGQDLAAPALLRLDGEGNPIPPTSVERALRSPLMWVGALSGAAVIGLVVLALIVVALIVLGGGASALLIGP